MTYSIDTFRRVYEDAEGCAITVADDGEIPGNVLMFTDAQHDKDYWGDFRVSMPKEFAAKLALALVEATKESSNA